MRLGRREPRPHSLKEPSTLPVDRFLPKQRPTCLPETLLERRPFSLPN